MAVLLVRRRHPLLAMTLFCGAGAAGTWVQARLLDSPDESFVPVLVLFVLSFALGAYADRRAVLWGAPQPVFLVVLVDLLEPGQGLVGATVFVSVFVVALPVAAGRLVRSRRRLLIELRHLEAAAALEHHQRLRRVRAEESVRVVGRLNETLEVGLEAMLSTDSIEDVEQQARRLLALTRDAVVGLSRNEDPDPEPSENRTRLRDGEVTEPSAQTWTLLVAAGIGAGLLTETSGSWHHTSLGLVLAAALVGAIVSMARHPLEGVLLAWVSAVLLSRAVVPLGNTFTGIGLVVALPFLTVWLGTRPRATIAVLGCLLAGVFGVRMSDPAGAIVLTGLAGVAGGILRDRSALLAEVRDARELADRRRRDELRTASLEQRASLGRELHDSIGHSLTVVALQAGAARRLQLSEPAAAAGARGTIEATARQALHDLRHGFDTGPGSIEGLLDTARAAGLEVDISGPLPPPDLAPIVYRVLQEALTNVLRHAPGARRPDPAVRTSRDMPGVRVHGDQRQRGRRTDPDVPERRPWALGDACPRGRGRRRCAVGTGWRWLHGDREDSDACGGGPVTTVVIVDDQDLVRNGLRLILGSEPDLEVVGEAADGTAGRGLVAELDPDVVLMDVQMPGEDGLTATRRLAAEGARCRILVLTTFDLDEYVYDALAAGASGFLLKDMAGEEICNAVRQAARGTDALLAPAVTRRLVERFARSGSRRPAGSPGHRPAHRARARGARADGRRPDQPRDRRAPLHRRDHREDPCGSDLHQARRPRPGPSRHHAHECGVVPR